MKPATHDIAAQLTIEGAADMSPARRHEIAKWLRREAAFLTREGHDFALRYRARYHRPRGEA